LVCRLQFSARHFRLNTDRKVLNVQVSTLKHFSLWGFNWKVLVCVAQIWECKDQQTKQNLYELDFIVDEVLFYTFMIWNIILNCLALCTPSPMLLFLLFYDLKHYIGLPCIVHTISHVVFLLFLSPVILECCLRERR
jgi:hypothetical protein